MLAEWRDEWINCQRLNIRKEKANTNKIQAADYTELTLGGGFPCSLPGAAIAKASF